jgi:hypothetical protein
MSQLRLSIGRWRRAPLIGFSHAIKNPRAEQLGSVRRRHALQMMKDHIDSLSNDHETRGEHDVFLSAPKRRPGEERSESHLAEMDHPGQRGASTMTCGEPRIIPCSLAQSARSSARLLEHRASDH